MKLDNIVRFIRLRSSQLTFIYCGAFGCLGMVIASLGPALLQLSQHCNVEIGTMGFVFTARSVGYLIGAAGGQQHKHNK
jgi:hypothetical protein